MNTLTKSIHAGIQWQEEGQEYYFKCSACGHDLYAPTLKTIQKAIPKHTRSKECLGGY